RSSNASAHMNRRFRQWLAEGLRLTKIYRRLRAADIAVSYSSLYRFARSTCEFAAPTLMVRMADPPPGEVAEVDFGVLGTGSTPAVSGAGGCTACSSRCATVATRSWHSACGRISPPCSMPWKRRAFFGDVVRRLVVDNLTPAVTRPIATRRG